MTESKFFDEIFQCCDRQRSMTYHKQFNTSSKHYKTNINSPTASPPYHFYSFSNNHHIHHKISLKDKKNQLNLPLKTKTKHINTHHQQPLQKQLPSYKPPNQTRLTHIIQHIPNKKVYRNSHHIVSNPSHLQYQPYSNHINYNTQQYHRQQYHRQQYHRQQYHRYQSSFQPNILINYKSNPQLATSLPKIQEQVQRQSKIQKNSLKSYHKKKQQQSKICSQVIKITLPTSNHKRKSQLENIKQSCISKNSQIQVQKDKIKGQINLNIVNPQNHNYNTPSFTKRYQQNFGLSIMSINSASEQVSYSKIKQNVQQSVVMHDFFNPAKKLFNKWNDKKKN